MYVFYTSSCSDVCHNEHRILVWQCEGFLLFILQRLLMGVNLFLWKYWHHNYRAINIQIFQFYSDFNASGLVLSKHVFKPSKHSVFLSRVNTWGRKSVFTKVVRENSAWSAKIVKKLNLIFVFDWGIYHDYPIFIPFRKTLLLLLNA